MITHISSKLGLGVIAFSLLMGVSGVVPSLLLAQDLPPVQDPPPVGLWKTVSDHTGEVTSIVNIILNDSGELVGKVDELFPKPGENPNPICDLCEGEKKDQPILGMTILWGLTQDGDDEWSGGFILDPDDGNSYRSIVKVKDTGATLHVRGYIGFSLFGRTQVWLRAD